MITERIETIVKSKLSKILFCSIIGIIVLCSFAIFIAKKEINADGCYYIAVSRLLNDGLVPYKDFNLGYTPLSFYMMQIPNLLWGQDFILSIMVLSVITLFNGYLIYRISYHHYNSHIISIWCASLFLLFSLVWGKEYILEPFILLFGFLSLLYVDETNKWKLLLCGFLSFCSFWSKQYGLGFLLLAMSYQFFKYRFNKQSLRNNFWIILGFIIGAFVFISILLLQGVEVNQIFGLSGSDYEKDGIEGLLGAYLTIFKLIPMLICAVVLFVIKFKRAISNPLFVMSMLGIGGFILQCYVRFYAHYLWLVVPFCALILLSCITLIDKDAIRFYYKVALFGSLIIPLYFVVKSDFSLFNNHQRIQQEEFSSQISELIPNGTDNVFVSQDMLYASLINEYNPPLLKGYGLSNGFVREPEEILDLCQNAEYAIIGVDEINNQKRFNEQVLSYLAKAFSSDTICNSENNPICFVLKRND